MEMVVAEAKPVDREKVGSDGRSAFVAFADVSVAFARVLFQRPSSSRVRVRARHNAGQRVANIHLVESHQNEESLQICRLDCSLRELMGLIKEVNNDTRRPGTHFDFAVVRPDAHPGQFEMRELGSTTSGQKGLDDMKTLQELKFIIGDYVDVAVSASVSVSSLRCRCTCRTQPAVARWACAARAARLRWAERAAAGAATTTTAVDAAAIAGDM